jgi:hypothetical protein
MAPGLDLESAGGPAATPPRPQGRTIFEANTELETRTKIRLRADPAIFSRLKVALEH